MQCPLLNTHSEKSIHNLTFSPNFYLVNVIQSTQKLAHMKSTHISMSPYNSSATPNYPTIGFKDVYYSGCSNLAS